MALDPCTPCGCDPGQLITDNRRANDIIISRILCQQVEGLAAILAALEVIAPGSTQPANATVAPVPSAVVSTTLLAANPLRRGAIFYNDSTEIVYIKLGAAASLVSYTLQLNPGGSYILTSPIYTGIVTAIWPVANGNMLVTEILP